jgi:thioredoxin 2
MRERAVCGKCKHELSLDGGYPDHPVAVTDGTFPREVLGFAGPVVVFIWGPWCGHCRRMTPVYEQLAAEYAGRVKFAKLLQDQNPLTSSHYKVQGVPNLLFFKRGKLVNQMVGALPREELERQLRAIL